MSEEKMRSCPFCGHKTPTTAQTREKHLVLCVNCWAHGPEASTCEEATRLWNARADDEPVNASAAPASLPWHDASEKPEPCRLCVVQFRSNMGSPHPWHYTVYYDSVRDAWRDEAGEVFDGVALRWQYLDTGEVSK